MSFDRSPRLRAARYRRLIAVSAVVAATISCHGDSTGLQAAVAAVVVGGLPVGGALLTGQTAQLTASVTDVSGAVLANRPISWSSSNAAAVSVSATGLATAAAVGTATITATSEGQSGTAEISGRAPIATPAAGATQATTSTLVGGAVVITVPPGAAAAGTTLSVGPASATSFPASTRLLAPTVFAFGPDGAQFATPLTLTLRFDPTGLSAADRSTLAIYVANAGNWDRISGSAVSATENVVSAPITHFSVFAVLKRADPAVVTVSAGNGQTASAGTAVSVRPSVFVADSRGQSIPGIGVTFAVVSGGGSITGAAATTDANGIATVGNWTLGPVAGANVLSATVSGLNAIAISATASAPPPPAILLSASTSTFSYTLGNASPPAQTISVTNVGGSPLVDLAVGTISYSGTASGWLSATLSAATAPATVTLVVTPVPTLGAGTFTATVPITSAASSNSPRVLSVTLTTVASAARVLATTTVPADARSGVVFGTQPVVEVRDAAGNRVTTSSHTVTASVLIGGTLEGTVAVVASAGVARFTNLKVTGKGATELQFESASLLPATTPSFWVADGTAANLGVYGGNNQTAEVLTALPTPVSVRVTDVDGFPVPGVLVSWTLQQGGGSYAAASALTNSSGVASVIWTLGPTVGVQQIAAIVPGATGSPVTFSATATAAPLAAILKENHAPPP